MCVDRHSGSIFAIPSLNKGLTGEKVAKAMIKNQWRPFGVPSLILSDQGSQFVGSCGKLCAPFWAKVTQYPKHTIKGQMGGPSGRANSFLSV